MANLSDDFLEFLRVNFPDAYRRGSIKDLPEDVATSLMSRYGHRYEIWKKIPDDVKNKYGGRVPPEVLNGNITVHDYVVSERNKTAQEEKDRSELLTFSVSMLALGYTTETVATLMENRETREMLLAASKDGVLSDEQHAKWILSRIADFHAIATDWQEMQPEKYALHLAKSLSREKKRQARGGADFDMEASNQKIKEIEQELAGITARLDTRGSRQNMVDFLRGQSQQSALRHLDPEVLAMFTGLMEKQGIRIQPVRGDNVLTNARGTSNYQSLSESLRKDFARMEKSEDLIRDVAVRGQRNQQRIDDRVQQKAKKQRDTARVVQMRGRSRRAQSA